MKQRMNLYVLKTGDLSLVEFVNSVANSFDKNIIDNNGWLVILKGLEITLFISITALLAGTIIGALLCSMRISKVGALKISAKIVIAFLRGSPVLLLLMVFYYVVFANSRFDAVFIAIIAFALNSGAHIAEIMRSALSAVDVRQLEAARMLGFSKIRAFMAITLPQATRIAKPVYQSATINLVQWTSVVGYVSITDLTRTVNNIGARTGDPFFALFFGILIYLAISYMVNFIFSLQGRKKITL
ncbi:MAG: amino acid ABC transporter permease [Bacteroidales bacterium]|jgi:polar amino acid transport system permease protein/polar amino acid transport system substrate-binding protein|nr:amino acid ABC transporter permease [Bacteroidales bacterium]MDD4057869.1 amino acid ABC transporter permease [Bacteroidales bacterium]